MKFLFSLSFLFHFLIANPVFAAVDIELFKGISVSVEKVFPEEIKAAEFEEDQYVLNIEIGKIDRSKFDLLKALYNNSSKVKFNSDREYDLQDFLPPYAQAFNNKLFPPIIYNYRNSGLMDLFDGGEVWPIVKNGVEVSSNCWNASIEYLVSLYGLSGDEAYLYVPGMFSTASYFAENSDIIEESEILPGDILIVTNAEDDLLGTTIQHTAVVVGPNLVFEKVAPDATAPYRISFLSDIKSKFEKLTTDEDWLIPEVKFTYHRVEESEAKRIDLESLGMVYDEEISNEVSQELVRIHPEVKPQRLLQTCFPGLGGGCDPFMTQLEKFNLVVDQSGNSNFVLNTDNSTFIDLL